jgi:hypothetical protein
MTSKLFHVALLLPQKLAKFEKSNKIIEIIGKFGP